jgi:hypothetical protein
MTNRLNITADVTNMKTKKSNVLDSIIKIPVSKPTVLHQCGTWSIVYPARYTSKGGKVL